MSNGLAIMIGVGLGAVLAIGTALYYTFTESPHSNSNQRPSPRTRRPRSPERPRQRGARCGSCNLPLAGHAIKRLIPCKHVFHDVCLFQETVCPFPGCGQRIPGNL